MVFTRVDGHLKLNYLAISKSWWAVQFLRPFTLGRKVWNLLDERSILEADFDLFLDSGRISGSVTSKIIMDFHPSANQMLTLVNVGTLTE